MSVLHHCILHQWPPPAISHLSPREARGFAERFIAVDNGVVHNLSIGKDEAGVGWKYRVSLGAAGTPAFSFIKCSNVVFLYDNKLCFAFIMFRSLLHGIVSASTPQCPHQTRITSLIQFTQCFFPVIQLRLIIFRKYRKLFLDIAFIGIVIIWMEKNVVTQPKATVFTRIFPYLFSKHFYCMIKDSFI